MVFIDIRELIVSPQKAEKKTLDLFEKESNSFGCTANLSKKPVNYIRYQLQLTSVVFIDIKELIISRQKAEKKLLTCILDKATVLSCAADPSTTKRIHTRLNRAKV